jgi:hypothetical protein
VGGKAVIEFLRRGARIGLAPSAVAHFHQRARLLRASRHDAARAVVLERAGNQLDAVGHEGRGQRVAGIAGHRLAVESEAERLLAVDQTARAQAMRLRAIGSL